MDCRLSRKRTVIIWIKDGMLILRMGLLGVIFSRVRNLTQNRHSAYPGPYITVEGLGF